MPRRHNRRRDLNSPGAVASRLPVQLRSFTAWLYDDAGKPTGLQDYLMALTAQVAPHEPMPVMQAAGLSVADWYRHKLTRGGTSGR